MNAKATGYGDDVGTPGGGFLSHLPVILWQRRWFIVVPLVLLTIAGFVAAKLMPHRYLATATLLVESQQLAPELVGSGDPGAIDKRIVRLREQLLSRPALVDLIQRERLYLDERAKKPLVAVVEDMRAATTLTPVSGTLSGDRAANTIAFQLSFQYANPTGAKLVAQDYVNRLLTLDAGQTAAVTQDTVRFLTTEAAGLSSQINRVEQQIEAIKARNGSALAVNGSALTLGTGGYDAQIAQLQRDNLQARSRLSAATSTSQSNPAVAAAEAQLAAMRAIYSDSHPDVRLAQSRLAEARRSAGARANDPTVAELSNDIAANNAMIASLSAARDRDQSRSSAAIAAQSRAPLVNEQVSQLEARADQMRQSYQTVANNLLNARAAARINQEQKGERLSVTDPPQVSNEPMKPSRPMIAIGGLVAGLALGIACALGVEFLRRPIRGIDGVERAIGREPLVVVPNLSGRHGRRRSLFGRRRRLRPQAG